MKNLSGKKILIFGQGTIGDMITAMPAIQRICAFHSDDIVHFHNTYPGNNDIHRTLFEHLDCFDRMFFSQVSENMFLSVSQRIKNWLHLLKERYDIIYDLPGNFPNPKWLLKAFLPKKVYTLDSLEPDCVPRFRFLLDFLAACGIPRIDGDENIDWKFTDEERKNAEQWFKSLNIPEGKIPFAMCTGGKCALQHWPLDRYAEVLKKIVPQYHLFPIFFGGPDDVKDAEFLIQSCGCGIWAGNKLNLREEILALKKCRFYLGNDTGVMHLAGAAGIPGLGIYSARIEPEYWKPLSGSIRQISADVPCKGCRKTVCNLPENEACIKRIPVYSILGILKELVHV